MCQVTLSPVPVTECHYLPSFKSPITSHHQHNEEQCEALMVVHIQTLALYYSPRKSSCLPCSYLSLAGSFLNVLFIILKHFTLTFSLISFAVYCLLAFFISVSHMTYTYLSSLVPHIPHKHGEDGAFPLLIDESSAFGIDYISPS